LKYFNCAETVAGKTFFAKMGEMRICNIFVNGVLKHEFILGNRIIQNWRKAKPGLFFKPVK
jgi:hypothetical protein